MDAIEALVQSATKSLEACQTLVELRDLQVEYLGKKGKISFLLKELGRLPPNERNARGQVINQLKDQVIALIMSRQTELQANAIAEQIALETVDITLPGTQSAEGSAHPITLARLRIEHYFEQLGFAVVEGHEIEDEFHNFTALNIPETHPARAMHDTFYLSNQSLLRTHTSPTQIRYMKVHSAPLRMIAPGRVYRCDSDVTHTPMFHQVEGLLIDKDVSMTDLKGVLTEFLRFYFDMPDLKLRFRASYFPFTEPSAEVDVQCVLCHGTGCRVCSQTGWLEILGCGMVHPHVLQAGNIDPEIFQGFAFGLGIDRMAMLRYQITDLRILFENDLRLLEQF
jgi:phenylalanyl-tRNA synthetase alpha chain